MRGQYTAGLVEGTPRIGYRAEPGVDPASRTDTFAALRLHLDTWRWEGVPILLRSGKRLASKAHEVAFRFKEPPTRLFRHTPLAHSDPNWLVFRMSPKECTELVMRTKQPGLDLESRESILRAEYTNADDHEASAYEQLLLEVLERRPHAVPSLRRGRVVVAHRRPGAQGVAVGRARGLRRGQRRSGRPAPLPRCGPRLAGVQRRDLIATSGCYLGGGVGTIT